MKKVKFLSLLCGIALMASSAYAQFDDSEEAEQPLAQKVRSVKSDDVDPAVWSVGVGAGIMGYNANIGYRMADRGFFSRRFGYRLDMNYVNMDIDGVTMEFGSNGEEKDVDINYNNKAYGFLVDFYPFTAFWRVTAGAYYSQFKLSGRIDFKTGDSIDLGSDTYASLADGDSLSLNISYDKAINPYLGTGFDLKLLFGLRISLDAGVLFHSGYNVDMVADLTVPDPVALQASVDEEIAQTKADANDFKMFPQVKVGIAYQF